MKRSLFSRLFALHYDYAFYIHPSHKMGELRSAIRSGGTNDKKKLLFMERHQGNVTFGIREELPLRDEVQRLRASFTGYQLEPHESMEKVPFHDALKEKFQAITEESCRLHKHLDTDPNSANHLKEAEIQFASGTYQPGNAWDEAVMKLRNEKSDFIMMFDEHGTSLTKALAARLEHKKAMSSPKKEENATSHASVPTRIQPSSSVIDEQIKTQAHGHGNKIAIIGGSVVLLGTLGYWAYKALRKPEPSSEKALS